MSGEQLLSSEDNLQIEKTIGEIENQTSAEIKVVVARHCWIDIRKKAEQLFYHYGLHQTEQRNAVMIMLVTANREFLVYGDKGIHEKVGDDFWLQSRDVMLEEFKQGHMGKGVCAGLQKIGEQLAIYFPASDNDQNELGNEVVYE